MDIVKVLMQGYAQKESSGRYNATSATVLVRSLDKAVLIDPGLKPAELKGALKREKLEIAAIDIVITSHSHMDHARNSKLFDNTKVLNPFAQYKKIPDNLVIPGTDIRVIFTPGHVNKHLSFLINTPEGVYAVAGDVFWWEDSEEQKVDALSLIEHADPIANYFAMLKESRKKLLSMADFIIPGHGKIFPVAH